MTNTTSFNFPYLLPFVKISNWWERYVKISFKYRKNSIFSWILLFCYFFRCCRKHFCGLLYVEGRLILLSPRVLRWIRLDPRGFSHFLRGNPRHRTPSSRLTMTSYWEAGNLDDCSMMSNQFSEYYGSFMLFQKFKSFHQIFKLISKVGLIYLW